MKKFLFIFFLFILTQFLSGQTNLVPNPGFEDTISCPNNGGQLYKAAWWINPSSSGGSSPDYFNSCSPLFANVPNYAAGFQYAKSGQAYAAFYGYQEPYPNEYEYVETTLTDTLKKDSIYCVSFYLNLCDYCKYGTNEIGVYFSNSLTTTTTNIIIATPQLVNTTVKLTDTMGWMKLSWQYKASGGEKYITIGNYNNTSTFDTVYVGGAIQGAYYLIDEVFVGRCSPMSPAQELMIPTLIGFDQNFAIKGLPENSTLYLYNMIGQIVYKDEHYSNKLNALDLSAGIYLYRLLLPNGDIYKGKLCVVH